MLGASDPTPLLLAWMGPLLAGFTAPTADSDDGARLFRDHVARCSDMMSPA